MVAPAWAEQAGFLDERGGPTTARMLELTAPAPGERVLELGCGAGGPGLAAAPVVAPGEVVVSDVAPEMVEAAAARAAGQGLANVRARVLDLEQIDEPDASFDVALCARRSCSCSTRCGRPARSCGSCAREAARRSRSGALASATPGWASSSTPSRSSSRCPSRRPASPTVLARGAGQLADVLTEAGFAAASRSPALPAPMRAATADEWWDRVTASPGRSPSGSGRCPRRSAASCASARRRASRPSLTTADGIDLPARRSSPSGAALTLSARSAAPRGAARRHAASSPR